LRGLVTSVPFSEVAVAVEAVAAGTAIGKLVVEVGEITER
jgi:hypothetical protein